MAVSPSSSATPAWVMRQRMLGSLRDDVRYRPLDRVDEAEIVGVDGDAGFDAARQAGLGRQFRQIVQAVTPGDLADRRLVDFGFDEGMDHAALGCGLQSGTVIAEIVQVGAGRDGALGDRAYRGRRGWICRNSSGPPDWRGSAGLRTRRRRPGQRPALAVGMGADTGCRHAAARRARRRAAC